LLLGHTETRPAPEALPERVAGRVGAGDAEKPAAPTTTMEHASMPQDTSPLLLSVQMNVAPAHEDAFNDWYHAHVPHLLTVPGYRWGRRYRAVMGEVAYLALYEIAARAWLPRLLGPDTAQRPDVVNDEFARFGELQGLSDVTINVYEQIYGPAFAGLLMARDYPLSVVTADCRPEVETEFNRWYDESHVPNLMQVPGYVSGMRFRLANDPALAHLQMSPRYLALYEIAGLDDVPYIADPERMSPGAQAEFENFRTIGVPMLAGAIRWNIYRPLAKHWPADG
jgi:hypothetical protein